ncbi:MULTISPECIES: hypothetical protein [Alteribacter]|uniref:Uncharacterized protein n=1 Tax=Alteribacter keqinensis TaxID=2483800 RepID=A0A3M7TX98_9BACI|nr:MULTISPECIES: hypothetical protein [Alteribacter]MBM7097663.1 hypothetical protein [Alteribacter salitolerans]RNA70123.1 hypothetical protein EBO34_09400 [Alteribacter keqinensis]
MTFLIPVWLYIVMRLGLIVILALSFSMIWTYVFYKLTGNPRGWRPVTAIWICTFISLVLIQSQFEQHYVASDEVVLSGKGNILEPKRENDIVVTSDENTVILVSRRLDQSKEYEFQTSDALTVAMQLSFQADRHPVDNLSSMHTDWAIEGIELAGPYFSSTTFFRDVFEKQAESRLTEALSSTSTADLTNDTIETIIQDIKSSLPHGDTFNINLTAWEILE